MSMNHLCGTCLADRQAPTSLIIFYQSFHLPAGKAGLAFKNKYKK
jgi:hypothetical protein